MQLRRSVAALALILCAVAAYTAPSSRPMATNAEGGTFASGRRYWFSVGPRERLRLVLDGIEIYRGTGPASAELPAVEGEERHYNLLAERLNPAPDDGLLESRSFLVVVDASPPAAPVLGGKPRRNGGWTISVSAEDRVRVDAITSADGVLTEHRSLQDGAEFSARRLSILAWAVDAAGNCSEPVSYEGEPFSLVVANPAPGRWANRQRLLVMAEGAEEILWTDDGSDPLGGQGRRYEKSILIDKAGEVRLRIASRSPDGRLERREIAYSVVEAPGGPLADLREAEAAPVLDESSVVVPSGFRWDAAASYPSGLEDATELRYEGGRAVVLRPVRSLVRAFPLLVGDSGLPHRFAFELGGRGGDRERLDATAAEGTAFPEAAGIDSGPKLRASGNARTLVWPRSTGHIRYRLGGSERWHDATSPVGVSASGTTVEWIVEDGAAQDGPFSLSIPAAKEYSDGALPAATAAEKAFTSSAVVLSSADGRDSARFSLRVPGSLPSRIITLKSSSPLVLDVCDGEELVWVLKPESGDAVRSWTIDRAPPRLPRIDAPAEGSWITKAADVAVTGEDRTRAVVYRTPPSRKVEIVSFVGSMRLDPSPEGPESIRIEAISVDEAGNASPVATREFTIDATTVYAGAVGRETGEADGSRDRPYDTLDEAIAAARAGGLTRIRVISAAKLLGRPVLSEGLIIEGGYGPDGTAFGGQSFVTAADGAGLTVDGAASLIALSIRGDSASPLPLIHAESGAALQAFGCDLSGGALVVDASAASLSFVECRIISSGETSPRVTLLRSENSSVSFERSRLEISSSAAVATASDCRGGALVLRSVVVDVVARGSALALSLRGTTLSAEEVDARVAAGDYASVMDAGGLSFTWNGGALAATARDAALVTLDDCDGAFSNASFRVSAISSARALQVAGGFPSIMESEFSASHSARDAKAFSGSEPGAGSVGGNRFRGFSRIWGRRYAAEDIAAFNRRYAPRGSANSIVDAEDGE